MKSEMYWKTITIQEFYTKEKDIVYWHWKPVSFKRWYKVKTALPDIPYVKLNLPTPDGKEGK